MTPRTIWRIVSAGIFLCASITFASPAELASQRSSQAGVTITVTPLIAASDASSWNFKSVLDTHSQISAMT